MCSADIFLGLLAILFPPLPVWVKRGICSADSIINILLCTLGFIPGLIHAWYIIAKFPEPEYEYERVPDGERYSDGRVTYVIVHGSQTGRPRPAPAASNKAPGPSNNMSYGTNDSRSQGPAPTPSSSQGPAPAASSSQTPAHQGAGNSGEGSSEAAPPPSYAQVVASGDNKVQSSD